MMSGAFGQPVKTMPEAEEFYSSWTRDVVGCQDVQCLLNKSDADLVRAFVGQDGFDGDAGLSLTFVGDGASFNRSAAASVAAEGGVKSVPLLIGFTANEGVILDVSLEQSESRITLYCKHNIAEREI